MMKPTALFKEPYSVRARLAELGISLELLEDVMRAWSVAEASATAFEPATAPGTKGWIAGTGTLRQGQVQAQGWTALDVRNWPLVMRPDGRVAIAATSGDNMTGQPYDHVQPSTKNPKGSVVANAVSLNAEQLNLGEVITRDGALRLVRPGKAKQTKALVYFVLVFCNEKEVWAELSLPAQLKGNRVVRWAERVVLPKLERDRRPAEQDRHEDQGASIDVPVSRK